MNGVASVRGRTGALLLAFASAGLLGLSLHPPVSKDAAISKAIIADYPYWLESHVAILFAAVVAFLAAWIVSGIYPPGLRRPARAGGFLIAAGAVMLAAVAIADIAVLQRSAQTDTLAAFEAILLSISATFHVTVSLFAAGFAILAWALPSGGPVPRWVGTLGLPLMLIAIATSFGAIVAPAEVADAAALPGIFLVVGYAGLLGVTAFVARVAGRVPAPARGATP